MATMQLPKVDLGPALAALREAVGPGAQRLGKRLSEAFDGAARATSAGRGE
jgi:hypothetical protein